MKDSHKNSTYRIVSAFIFLFITILGVTPGGIIAQSSTWHEGSFTDSTGRTILYGYWLKNDWDTNQPRGVHIFFHGNNTASAYEIRRRRYPNNDILDLGLVNAYVASPGSSREGGYWASSTLFGFDINSYGKRKWINQDQRLIHELLQSGFNSTLAIDYDQIVFMGGSQGTGFLTTFFERYAGIYGGGFHAWCGPFQSGRQPFVEWMPSFQWTPFAASFIKSQFRVFVEATTGDFLHSDAVAMSKYYSESLGLETRWDLEAPGGHCSRGATPHKEIWEWLSSAPIPKRPGDETDTDGDGIANAVDPDDDNDGVLDFIDALPLDPRDWLDTDEDGIGNFADRDADGDGVDNALDPFPLDPREWLDTDEDGIGNTLDADDDNDGISDDIDASPLSGIRKDQLVFRMPEGGIEKNSRTIAFVHSGKPASVVYPEPQGDHQSYHFINLGDSANPRFQIMIDKFNINELGACEEVILPDLCDSEKIRYPFLYFGESKSIFKIYIDRNQNQNLTDDGPPLILERNNDASFSPLPGAKVVLEVPYASGDTFPYGIILSVNYWGTTERVHYIGASSWMGYVEVPSGEQVLVGVVDINRDGIFNSKRPPDDFYEGTQYAASDIACIDLDRNDVLNECTYGNNGERVSPVYPGEPFKLDGCQHTISVAPSGHQITWLTQQAMPQTLTKVSGDEQEGTPGTLLEMPLVVEVRDLNGNVLNCTQVTFAVTGGDGTLSVVSTITNAKGRASATLTLGTQTGINTVEVMVTGLAPETFTAVGQVTPDFDGNGTVDISDFLLFAEQFGLSQGDAGYDARFDLDGDGTIGIGDFLIFAEDFGKTVSSN